MVDESDDIDRHLQRHLGSVGEISLVPKDLIISLERYNPPQHVDRSVMSTVMIHTDIMKVLYDSYRDLIFITTKETA